MELHNNILFLYFFISFINFILFYFYFVLFCFVLFYFILSCFVLSFCDHHLANDPLERGSCIGK